MKLLRDKLPAVPYRVDALGPNSIAVKAWSSRSDSYFDALAVARELAESVPATEGIGYVATSRFGFALSYFKVGQSDLLYHTTLAGRFAVRRLGAAARRNARVDLPNNGASLG